MVGDEGESGRGLGVPGGLTGGEGWDRGTFGRDFQALP